MRLREPELEDEAIEVARQLGRENDPSYWRRKYFDMLAQNAQRERNRDMWLGGLLVSALAAAGVLLKWLFRW